MAVLAPLLPKRYAPLRATGDGLQNVYLTALSDVFAAALVDLIGAEARGIVTGRHMVEETPIRPGIGLLEWEEHELERLRGDGRLSETTRHAVVMARRGQGLFKERVMRIEHACRITGVRRVEHLRASHCKPWRDATNDERLDGENGLLLTPNADHLFDRGLIGFANSGDVLISPVAHIDSLERMGLDPRNPRNVGTFSAGQRRYLDFHREYVFLQSRFLENA
jgi:hypothetical protein